VGAAADLSNEVLSVNMIAIVSVCEVVGNSSHTLQQYTTTAYVHPCSTSINTQTDTHTPLQPSSPGIYYSSSSLTDASFSPLHVVQAGIGVTDDV